LQEAGDKACIPGEYEVTGGLQHLKVDALAEAIAALKALPVGTPPQCRSSSIQANTGRPAHPG